jgi:hypothetical protein
MTRRELEDRVNECTGAGRPRPETHSRTGPPTERNHQCNSIAEDHILRHLEWATFHFRDLVQYRLDGRNPFDNSQIRYRGSQDDIALNEGIERFAADPQAVAKLAYDSDLTGLILLPTTALHWDKDPTVSAEADRYYETRVQATEAVTISSAWFPQRVRTAGCRMRISWPRWHQPLSGSRRRANLRRLPCSRYAKSRLRW